jgi:radical SAM superfamily enzyme YgiQ (UPF0313 family)
MKANFLLINPWIYDFAAFNLWSRPLGLLKVAEYLSGFDCEIKFIDCTDRMQSEKKFGTGKYPRQSVKKPYILKEVPHTYARYGITAHEFIEKLTNCLPCDAIFVTSIMTYWYPGTQEVIKIIRSLSSDIPVILGGIYPTLYSDHARTHSGADHVFTGSIDSRINNTLQSLGITLNQGNKSLPYYRLNLYEHSRFAPLLTSTGCPYKCTYCASAILNKGFIQRHPQDVLQEIDELYQMGTRDFAFYDDALLANPDHHIKVLLREIIRSTMKVRFHCPNGIHAGFIDDELADLMKRSGFTTLRLGFETVNSRRQEETGGKVNHDSIRSAVRNLQKRGFEKEHIGTYLMYGLPGQELSEIREGIAFLKDLGVRINLTEFSPLPGTACWDELLDRRIISRSTDPLLMNNTVFSYMLNGHDPEDISSIKEDVMSYNIL